MDHDDHGHDHDHKHPSARAFFDESPCRYASVEEDMACIQKQYEKDIYAKGLLRASGRTGMLTDR